MKFDTMLISRARAREVRVDCNDGKTGKVMVVIMKFILVTLPWVSVGSLCYSNAALTREHVISWSYAWE